MLLSCFHLFLVLRYDPRGRKIDPILDQDYEIHTQMGRKAQTMLRIKTMGLSKAGNYMVKVFSETITKTENFTLVVRSKPKAHMSIKNPQDLYQVFVLNFKNYMVKRDLYQ